MAIFKSNVNDSHKYLFRQNYRTPTIVTESKESKKIFVELTKVDLTKFKATIAAPVAVLGDASSSMSVSTSTIKASLLATICQAKLTFFHSANFEAKLKDPKNMSDVLEIAYTTLASSSKSPAASLVALLQP